MARRRQVRSLSGGHACARYGSSYPLNPTLSVDVRWHLTSTTCGVLQPPSPTSLLPPPLSLLRLSVSLSPIASHLPVQQRLRKLLLPQRRTITMAGSHGSKNSPGESSHLVGQKCFLGCRAAVVLLIEGDNSAIQLRGGRWQYEFGGAHRTNGNGKRLTHPST
eukprot:359537-Chlamydomonas_euryale.AAC.6